MIQPFQTVFAVPLDCEGCIKDVKKSLFGLSGVLKVECDLFEQLVAIEGTVPPSLIVEALKNGGKDAILRGSGTANSAAVCILETHCPEITDPVKGLARMVQVSPMLTLIDLTVKGVKQGTYAATMRVNGDISDGAASTGTIWGEKIDGVKRGSFGTFEVDLNGTGRAFLQQPIAIWEMIGRSLIVSKIAPDGPFPKNDQDVLVGVIARSAGVWQNQKTVCSCSGKTVWEEREEHVRKGMM